MSSNHLKYDTCAYATTIKESTEPLEYYLYRGKYEVCEACPNGDFTNNIDFPSRADVESELFGLTRLGSDCPSLKYDPTKKFNYPLFSPPIMCQNIYGITPSNLVNPTSNMLNENNLGVNLCSLPSKNVEKFSTSATVPLVMLLKGYNNLSDSSIVMNLYDKVEPGINSDLVLNAIINKVNLVNPEDFYSKDITPSQINNLNTKINNKLSCN